MHLRVALERLHDRYGVNVKSQPPRSAIRKPSASPSPSADATRSSPGAMASSAMWCWRSGRCRAAPASLRRQDRRRRGAAQLHRAVEEGVVDELTRGPLGFPVIDVQATLADGSYHSVDSSDQAFRTAARIGISEALPKCQPVLLEPIDVVEIVSQATRRRRSTPSSRPGAARSRLRPRESWTGWDCVRATMPEAEIGDLIVELRSATAGAGSFTRQFDRRPSHRPGRRPDHRRASGRG